MSLEGALDLMAPVQTSSGKTVWIKVGVYFPNDRRGEYVGTVSLLTLPVGATAPVELYAYPSRKESGIPRGKKTRGGRPSYAERPPHAEGDEPFEDPEDVESPGGDDPRGGV